MSSGRVQDRIPQFEQYPENNRRVKVFEAIDPAKVQNALPDDTDLYPDRVCNKVYVLDGFVEHALGALPSQSSARSIAMTRQAMKSNLDPLAIPALSKSPTGITGLAEITKGGLPTGAER